MGEVQTLCGQAGEAPFDVLAAQVAALLTQRAVPGDIALVGPGRGTKPACAAGLRACLGEEAQGLRVWTPLALAAAILDDPAADPREAYGKALALLRDDPRVLEDWGASYVLVDCADLLSPGALALCRAVARRRCVYVDPTARPRAVSAPWAHTVKWAGYDQEATGVAAFVRRELELLAPVFGDEVQEGVEPDAQFACGIYVAVPHGAYARRVIEALAAADVEVATLPGQGTYGPRTVFVGTPEALALFAPRVLVAAGFNEGSVAASSVRAYRHLFAVAAQALLVTYVQSAAPDEAGAMRATVKRTATRRGCELAMLAPAPALIDLGRDVPPTMSGEQFLSAVLGMRG